MGIYIALGFVSVIAIAIGIALAKAKETQLWYILSIIGTAVLTVMIVFIINSQYQLIRVFRRLLLKTQIGESRNHIQEIISLRMIYQFAFQFLMTQADMQYMIHTTVKE